jgi:hypothetical protein
MRTKAVPPSCHIKIDNSALQPVSLTPARSQPRYAAATTYGAFAGATGFGGGGGCVR